MLPATAMTHMNRREFVAFAAAGAATLLGTGRARASTSITTSVTTSLLPPMQPARESYAFTLGTRRCVAVMDGTHAYQADRYFLDVPSEAVTRALARHGAPSPDHIPSPFTCLAVADDTGGWTLLDTGVRELSPTAGRLHHNLVAAGVEPERVSTVVLTHAHPDHIGGIVDGDGRLLYPNARYVMREPEWAFWTSDLGLAKVPPMFAEAARKHLPPIRDRLTTVTREAEVAPDVSLVPAEGHTPGHAIAIVHPGREQLHVISDTVLHPVHLEQPAWETDYDMDRVRAAAAKRAVFDRAASERALVLGFHFDPFPGLGHVARRGTGWAWERERT
jgi:glyoxylase-like metal-dependent hydrolase (beta-lactamase superfamily II)